MQQKKGSAQTRAMTEEVIARFNLTGGGDRRFVVGEENRESGFSCECQSFLF